LKKVVRKLWGYVLAVAMVISLGCNIPAAHAEEYWGEEVATAQDASVEVASAQDAQEEVQGSIEDNVNSVEAIIGTLDLDKEMNVYSRTKEEITKKFVEAVNNRDAKVIVEEGLSDAPYKPCIITESAQDSIFKLANYYRYLTHLSNLKLSTDEDYSWEASAYASPLLDRYFEGKFGNPVREPSDMSDEYYYKCWNAFGVILRNSEDVGADKEADLITCYREVLNPMVTKNDGSEKLKSNYNQGYILYREGTRVLGGVTGDSFGLGVMGNSYYNTSPYPIAMWPSAGYFPVEEISQDMIWSVGGNLYIYKCDGNPSVKITDTSTGKVYTPEVTYNNNTMYFAPPAVDSFKGKKFKVELKGFISEDSDLPVTLAYTIDFFSYSDVKLNIDGKTYTCDEYGNLFTYPEINVNYRTHVQTFGWEGNASDIKTWKSNGTMSGTSGKAKRLEGINIVVNPKTADDKLDLGIQYTTHCQSYGWLPWSANGEMNGTEGEAKRLEAIKIQLTGEHANLYDVYYRVHAQSYGWLGWAKNGAPAGTAGYGKRLEGIQIVVVKKGASFNQKMEGITSARAEAFVAKAGESPIVNYAPTSNTNPVVPGAQNVNVAYRTHVQSYGWQAWKYNGQMSGTSGEAKRLEGINIELRNKDCSGGIVYTTHVQSYGWQGKLSDQSTWKKNGEMSGTSGEAKRLEAICINLTGDMSKKYDIYYRVHAQSYGWLGWAKNGAPAGTAGYGKRLEGIQIVLVPKGGAAPGNHQGVVSANASAYVEKK